MKTFFIFIITGMTLLGCSTVIKSNRGVASSQDRELYQVGEVKISLLDVDEFRDKYGDVWVLMDGRDVSGTEFMMLTSMSNLPDARGKFLRMANNGALCRQGENNCQFDPENSPLGSYQKDELRSHKHSLAPYFSKGTVAYSGNITPMTNYPGTVEETNNTGGAETRPKNITVNYFIKINSCSSTSGTCL